MPSGLAVAADRWGTLPLATLAEPAAALARDGVALNAQQAYVFEILAGIVLTTPEARELFAPDGRVLREGDTYRNPQQAETIERLGAEGAEPFYRGDIAAAVAEWLGARGSLLTSAGQPQQSSWRGLSSSTSGASATASSCSRKARRSHVSIRARHARSPT